MLLVIACPCRLGDFDAGQRTSRRHRRRCSARVLIKGGAFVETPGRLKAIAFDKTGTVAAGKPSVVGIYPLNGHTETELLERIASLEAQSEHLLGKAILAYAQQKKIRIPPAEDFQIVSGKGATARIQGKNSWLGTERFLEERKQKTAEVQTKLNALARDGVTVVVVGNDEHVCGYLTLSDEVRSSDKARFRHCETGNRTDRDFDW